QGDDLVVLDFDEKRVAVRILLPVLEASEASRLDRNNRPLGNHAVDVDLGVARHKEAARRAKKIFNDFLSTLLFSRALNPDCHYIPRSLLVQQHPQALEVA